MGLEFATCALGHVCVFGDIHPVCLGHTWILPFILKELQIGLSFHA